MRNCPAPHCPQGYTGVHNEHPCNIFFFSCFVKILLLEQVQSASLKKVKGLAVRPSQLIVPAAPRAKVSFARRCRAAPSPDLAPGEAPASAARASRRVLGAGGCCVSTSQPWATPWRGGQRPCPDPRGLEEERSSFIPAPRCRRPAASALSSLSVSPYPRFSYFSTSLPGYPKPRFSPLPGWHVSLWASAAG